MYEITLLSSEPGVLCNKIADNLVGEVSVDLSEFGLLLWVKICHDFYTGKELLDLLK